MKKKPQPPVVLMAAYDALEALRTRCERCGYTRVRRGAELPKKCPQCQNPLSTAVADPVGLRKP